jgi:hypothetical protein
MPCYDGREDLGHHRCDHYISFDSQREYDETVLYKSLATPLLCEAMKIIKDNGLVNQCSSKLVIWDSKHESDDMERVKKVYQEIRQKQAEVQSLYSQLDTDDLKLLQKVIDEINEKE